MRVSIAAVLASSAESRSRKRASSARRLANVEAR